MYSLSLLLSLWRALAFSQGEEREGDQKSDRQTIVSTILLWYKIVPNFLVFPLKMGTMVQKKVIQLFYIQLDGVGPVDNRPSTD